MPPRLLTAAIIAFWLSTTGWLFYREVAPRLWPGAPPPFTIDLADEAQRDISASWTIKQHDVRKGYCRTWIFYHQEDDTFELKGEFKLWDKGQKDTLPDLFINSGYRITREGALRGIIAQLIAQLPGNLRVDGEIRGDVRGGLFRPRITLFQPVEYTQELKPVRVSTGGSVLNPLQPIQRLSGLRKGQRWQITLVDPLTDLAHHYVKELTGAATGPEVRVLRAQVLPETETLILGTLKEEFPCLVVEYQGEDITARTWVRESDGLVLQQEITQGSEQYVLTRDL